MHEELAAAEAELEAAIESLKRAVRKMKTAARLREGRNDHAARAKLGRILWKVGRAANQTSFAGMIAGDMLGASEPYESEADGVRSIVQGQEIRRADNSEDASSTEVSRQVPVDDGGRQGTLVPDQDGQADVRPGHGGAGSLRHEGTRAAEHLPNVQPTIGGEDTILRQVDRQDVATGAGVDVSFY